MNRGVVKKRFTCDKCNLTQILDVDESKAFYGAKKPEEWVDFMVDSNDELELLLCRNCDLELTQVIKDWLGPKKEVHPESQLSFQALLAQQVEDWEP